MAEEKYITTATLKADRAWTDRLIRKFLAEPDKVAPNPRFRTTGAPMRLYALSRVEAIEATEAFAAECATAERRRKASAKAVITRSNNMDAAMEAAEITIVAGKTREQIRYLATQTHGGNYMGDPGPSYFDNWVAVNCIRHNLTNYESLWQSCNRGWTGETAYQILRERVGALIRDAATTRPEFATELPRFAGYVRDFFTPQEIQTHLARLSRERVESAAVNDNEEGDEFDADDELLRESPEEIAQRNRQFATSKNC